LDEAIGVLTHLIEKEPVPDYRYLLARCYLAKDRRRGGRFPEPGTSTQAAIGILRELASSHPNVPDYQYELAMAYAFSRSGGEENLPDAVNILDRLSREQGSVPQYVGSHLWVRSRLGESLLRQRKWNEAITQYERLVELFAQAVQRQPPETGPYLFGPRPMPRVRQAMEFDGRGIEQVTSGLEAAVRMASVVIDMQGVAGVLEAMKAKIDELASQGPQTSIGLVQLWVDAHLEWIDTRVELARVFSQFGDSQRAIETLAEATHALEAAEAKLRTTARPSAESSLGVDAFFGQLVLARAELCGARARVLMKSGDPGTATQELGDARQELEHYIGQLKPGVDLPQNWRLSEAHRRLGDILQLLGDERGADIARERSRELREPRNFGFDRNRPPGRPPAPPSGNSSRGGPNS
jgi:tetratricopeptide (TPR) repeat protein